MTTRKPERSVLEDLPDRFARFKPLLTAESSDPQALLAAIDKVLPKGLIETPNFLKRTLLAELFVQAHLDSKSGPSNRYFEESDLVKIARKLGWVSLCSPSVVREVANLAHERRVVLNQRRRGEIERILSRFGVALVHVGGRLPGAKDRRPRKRRIDGEATWAEFIRLANRIEEEKRLDRGGGRRALEAMAQQTGVSPEAIRKRLHRTKRKK